MRRWLRRIWRAIEATFVLDCCPWGDSPSASCRGCFLDRQWVGSLPSDHAPAAQPPAEQRLQ